MTTTSFAALSARAQVARLRPLALDALKAYSIEVAKLRLLNHGFNTMFRVDEVSGRRFAFRINVNSRRTAENVQAEIAWLQVLRRDTDLRVPEVIVARDGSFMQSVSVDGLPMPVPAVLFNWLPGPNLEERLSVPAVEA
jgi:Ser/Thr protein kinase RdoA (MazF antagonist)